MTSKNRFCYFTHTIEMNHWHRMKRLPEMTDSMSFVIDSTASTGTIEVESPDLFHCQLRFALSTDAITNSSLLANSKKMKKLANFFFHREECQNSISLICNCNHNHLSALNEKTGKNSSIYQLPQTFLLLFTGPKEDTIMTATASL